MKVLMATSATQGKRPNDFHWCGECDVGTVVERRGDTFQVRG